MSPPNARIFLHFLSLFGALGALGVGPWQLFAGEPPRVEVVPSSSHLGNRAAEVLRQSFPEVRVVDTGSGEVVLLGKSNAVDQALALIQKLDRPAREVLVELHRGGHEALSSSQRSLGVGWNRPAPPSEFSKMRSRSRSTGVRTLRLREGSSASLSSGVQVPVRVSGPLGPQVHFVDASDRLQVRLVRVDPERGALLELVAGSARLGPSTPGGPTVVQDRVVTSTFAPFDRLVYLGGSTGETQGRSRSHSGGGQVQVFESGRLRQVRVRNSGELRTSSRSQSGGSSLGVWVRVRAVPDRGRSPAREPARGQD